MKQRVLITAAGLVAAMGSLQGQETNLTREIERYYQVLGRSANTKALDEGFGNRVVKGKPFSATEERRSLQVLGDGTRLESNQVNRIYRDSEGRTRVEAMDGKATIFDPVAGVRLEIDPVAKTARNVPAVPGGVAFRVQAPTNTKAGGGSTTSEDLRPDVVNGVNATGQRTTMTIPRGELGNDRDIRVVTERWISEDLQMLVKSTNSDPRFGETTYQLTGILLREPDASLFSVPAGYARPAAGGRGGARNGGLKTKQP